MTLTMMPRAMISFYFHYYACENTKNGQNLINFNLLLENHKFVNSQMFSSEKEKIVKIFMYQLHDVSKRIRRSERV